MPKPATHVVMLHGYGVSPEKMWFPWMHKELERLGVAVSAPAMPDPFRPDYKKWERTTKDLAARWTPQTVLVAHSLGGAFSLRMLERHAKTKLRAVILVAPLFASPFPAKQVLGFFDKPIDWWTVRERAEEFRILQAKDDPLVPFDHALRYQEALGADLTMFPKGGHFTGKKFPFLLSAVKKYLAK